MSIGGQEKKPQCRRLLVRCNVAVNWEKYGALPNASSRDSFVVVELDYNMKPFKKPTFWENWTSVMGTRWWEWILPITPTRSDDTKWWEFDFNDSTKEYLRKEAGNKIRLRSVAMQQEFLEANQEIPLSANLDSGSTKEQPSNVADM
jgi:hypothetical protein